MVAEQWTVVVLPAAAREIEHLPLGLRARMSRLVALIEQHGLAALRAPHGRQIEGKLWEMRVSAAEGIARGFYVTERSGQVVILHVFVKKSQATPQRNIDLAKARMKEVLG